MDYDDLEILTPRRARALGWTAAAALVLALAVVGLQLHGRARLDELRRELARQGSLDPRAYAPPVAREEDNAALAMLAAAREVETTRGDRGLLHEVHDRRPAAWPAAVRAAVERHLAANAEPLAAVHRAAALPGGGLGLDYGRLSPFAGRRPWDLAAAGRLLELEAHAALGRGDLETATAAAEALGRLAALLHAEPEVSLQLLALRFGGAQLNAVREIVAAGPPPPTLARLAAALSGSADRTALARAVRCQTAALLGPDTGRLARGVARDAGPLWQAAAWLAGDLLLAEGLTGRSELARVDELPFPLFADAVRRAEQPLELGPFAAIHVGLQAAALKADAAAAARQLAELACVLAAAAARDGRYPAALPDHPAATTPDPLTASLPSYRVAADGSARLWLARAEAKAGSAATLASLPFTWELPAPRPAGS